MFVCLQPAVDALDAEGIIGGQDALPGKYPYHVAIEIFGSFACGGAIIGEYFVVTAAHCVADDKGLTRLPIRVVGGTNDLSKHALAHKVVADVEKIYIPKEFNPANEATHIAHDIALLKVHLYLFIYNDCIKVPGNFVIFSVSIAAATSEIVVE